MTQDKKVDKKSTGKASAGTDVQKAKVKLKPEAIVVHAFGDLMKFSRRSPDILAPYRKYDALAVAWAESPRDERLMLYGFLLGVCLTAHARRIKDPARRKSVFDLKNKIFLSLANNFAFRKVLNFRLCQSKRFKVVRYCEDCTKANQETKALSRQWKFCFKCDVDRDYYNVLSMFHKHEKGGASLFLGNDLIPQVKGLRFLKRAKFGQLGEEVTFTKYTFSPKNLVALELKSSESAAQKIFELLEKLRDTELDKFASSYVQQGGQIRAKVPPGSDALPVTQGKQAALRPRPQLGQSAGPRPQNQLLTSPPSAPGRPAIRPKQGALPRSEPARDPQSQLNDSFQSPSRIRPVVKLKPHTPAAREVNAGTSESSGIEVTGSDESDKSK